MLEHLDELTELVCRENGKVGEKPKGGSKVIEHIEHACSMPSLLMGESCWTLPEGSIPCYTGNPWEYS